MKQILRMTMAAMLAMMLAQIAYAQTFTCDIAVDATAASSTAAYDNRSTNCSTWVLVLYSTGFSAQSTVVQVAPDVSGAPGSYATFTPTTGSNPTSTTTSTTVKFEGYYPWLRITLSSSTGTGRIKGRLYGYRYSAQSVFEGSGSGGGGSAPVASAACAGNPYASSSTSVTCSHSIGSAVHQVTCDAVSGGGPVVPSAVSKGGISDTIDFAGGLIASANCFVTGSLGVVAACTGNPYSLTASATCTHSLGNLVHAISCETASGAAPVLYSGLTKGANADTIAWAGTLIASTNCFAR